MDSSIINTKHLEEIKDIDQRLSNRFIKLDQSGYFLINIDSNEKKLIVKHFNNDLDELGRAIDPETGKPLSCKGGNQRLPQKIYEGRSAKEVGILLTEGEGPFPLSSLDHALYLGRELQRAEHCMLNNQTYIQD